MVKIRSFKEKVELQQGLKNKEERMTNEDIFIKKPPKESKLKTDYNFDTILEEKEYEAASDINKLLIAKTGMILLIVSHVILLILNLVTQNIAFALTLPVVVAVFLLLVSKVNFEMDFFYMQRVENHITTTQAMLNYFPFFKNLKDNNLSSILLLAGFIFLWLIANLFSLQILFLLALTMYFLLLLKLVTYYADKKIYSMHHLSIKLLVVLSVATLISGAKASDTYAIAIALLFIHTIITHWLTSFIMLIDGETKE